VFGTRLPMIRPEREYGQSVPLTGEKNGCCGTRA
jgi:hypothetical protein